MRQLLYLLPLLAVHTANAQTITWSASVPVATSMYSNSHPRLALSGNGSPMVLWGNNNNDNVYFSRWTGAAFSMPTKVNPGGTAVFASSWAGPDMASKGDTVYIVYKLVPEDTGRISIVRSVDGGATFSAPVRVDNIGMNGSRFPTVTTNAAGHPIVGFMKFDMGFTKARWVVTKSANWGATFPADVLASSYNMEPVCDCCPGAVVTSGNAATMLYRNNLSNKRTMWAGVSTDGGSTFPSGLEIDKTNWNINACPSTGPDGIIIGDTLYATFMSGAGGAKVYLSKSTLSGMQAGSAVALTGMSTGLTGQNFPRIAHDGNTAAIVWVQQESNMPQVGIRFTTNIQAGFGAWDTVVQNNSGDYIVNADVAVRNGVVHVVWEDMAKGTVMYRKGTFASSTSINAVRTDAMRLAPVPANELLHIDLNEDVVLRECSMRVVALTGQVVYERDYTSLSGRVSIPTADLPSGSYFIQLRSAGSLYVQQFMVNHP